MPAKKKKKPRSRTRNTAALQDDDAELHTWRQLQSALDGQSELGESRIDTVVHSGMVLQDTESAGRGWRAALPLEAGTTLLQCSPIAFTLDTVADEISEDEKAITGLLIIAVAEILAGSGGEEVWSGIDQLHPRELVAGGERWCCEDLAVQCKVDAALAEVLFLDAEQKERLTLIVKHNNLGMYTNSEQLSYSEGPYSDLSGVALYQEASYFNHSCTPNVARYNIGPVIVFVTNQPVPAGDELCISYIENELLYEPPALRAQLLAGRDFSICVPAEDDPDPDWPVLGPEVQEDMFAMPVQERLSTVQAMLSSEEAQEQLHKVDHKELSLMQAVAYAELADHEAELDCWKQCIRFAQELCPANDESLVCYRVQATLSLLAAGKKMAAKSELQQALAAHQLAFGGGVQLFVARYRHEVENASFRQNSAALSKAFWDLLN